ncbi:hypothetical protein [Streptomyces sp. NPDC046197]|uniref:hypothetical protein n=1 Tax=Streptomyces sp. NPDC046197 TaxID=3154337 RepID=UPI00340DFDF5
MAVTAGAEPGRRRHSHGPPTSQTRDAVGPADTRHRLGDVGRCLYLFLAAPLLDLPALGVIAAGRSTEGLAMIVAMLPIGIMAAVTTWSWVNRGERLAGDVLTTASGGDAHAG